MSRYAPRLDTLLARVGRKSDDFQGAVNMPVIRASTRLYPDLAAYESSRSEKFGQFRYGRYGTPTALALEEAIAILDGGYRAVVLPSGIAAIAGVLRALLKSGDHLLVVDSVFEPVRRFCSDVLAQEGIETTFYAPSRGEDIEASVRPRTRLVYCESPGSLTLEVQDIPAIARAAGRHGIPVVADNTWATPYYFRPFEHGVDISIHAATKYIVGHSDAMLGVVVTNELLYDKVRASFAEHGLTASPDDCWLALRGLRTLGVRLRQHQAGALRVAEWLASRNEITRVYYPALSEDPGHALWKRDFSGASGVLSAEFRPDLNDAVRPFVDALEFFGIGSSWGGYESLVLPAKPKRTTTPPPAGPLLRLHIGLEDPDDLIDDLEGALASAISRIHPHAKTGGNPRTKEDAHVPRR